MSTPAASEQIWQKIRDEYESTKTSCRRLAERFGLKPNTVSTRCRREKWRKSGKFLDQRMSAKIEEKLEARAESLAKHAENFVTRTIREGEKWLDKIEAAEALRQAGDTERLKELLNCWTLAIQSTRKAFRLDEDISVTPHVALNFNLVEITVDEPATEISSGMIGQPLRA